MARTNLAIRTATVPDLDRVAEIYAHYIYETVITFDETPPTVGQWQQKHAGIADRGLPFLVAHDAAERVVGFAYANSWRPKPAYRYTVEDTIYLDPAYTGQGLGSSLLGRLVAECADSGMRLIVAVIADTGGAASSALHRRFGFRDAGRLAAVGYKHGQWIDTILMQRSLSASR